MPSRPMFSISTTSSRTKDFELNAENFQTIKLPNEPNFFDDDREVAEKAFWRKIPCMTNCAPGAAQDHRPRPRAST